jgi:hypothetical protein
VPTRTVEVPPERLVGWFERYAATHPGTVAMAAEGGVRLTADNSAAVQMSPLRPFGPDPELSGSDLVAALADHAAGPVVTALVLIRRGGYAVGVALGGDLLHSKVGSRYVQSRTAAGGWSQQRFARRREGQAKELVRAAAQAWSGLARTPAPAVLVTGGDHSLADQVLAEPALRALAGLGSARHLDLPDPRLSVLRDAAARAQALLVTLREP